MGETSPDYAGTQEDRVRTFEDSAWLATMELATLSSLPMALKAALNLEVFEIIAKNGTECPLSANEIASHIPTSNPNAASLLDRVLRVLACHSMLSSSCQLNNSGRIVTRYALTPLCKYLVKDEKGLSLRALLTLAQDRVLLDAWQHIDCAILDDAEPFTKAHGKNLSNYGLEDMGFQRLFISAMENYSTLLMQGLLDVYDGFTDINVLVDVGGGRGACLNMILKKNPHLQGINFDQPCVIADAPAFTGVEHVGGDMFDTIPMGDAIFMKWILHDWSDEQCVKLLQNCHKALPKNGKVIAVDAVLPREADGSMTSRVVAHLDLLMLAVSPGGRTRTEAKFKELALAASFASCKIICIFNAMSVIEFYKA